MNRFSSLTLFRSLKERNFAYLWGGQLLSRIGDFVYQIVLAWWILEKTGSATLMASVLVFAFAPTIIFSLMGGVAVDRYPRIQIMIASDLVSGVAVCLIATLAWLDNMQIWHVYALSLMLGIVDAFFQPAYAATIPNIVPEEDLPSANSLTSLSIQAGRIAGPALGAALIAFGGITFAFVINGLTFFISVAFLLPLLKVESSAGAKEAEENQSLLVNFKDGIQTVFAAPWLWISIAVFTLSNVTLAGPYSVTLPFLVKDHLGADVGTLGLFYSLFATGYVVGGIWLGGQSRIRQRGRLIYGGLIVAGIMLLAFGLPVGIVGLAIAALINGAALEVGGLAWTNTLQELVPREKLGRVVSVDSVGSFALVPIGYGLTGWATEFLGAPLIFILGGGLTALTALCALYHPAIRSLD